MKPEELRRLSQTRIKEASVLLEHEYHEGAVYLAGYAVELALKEMITKIMNGIILVEKRRATF